ncbi:MAG: HEAT repeat domain-containing protein, partial [Calditrichota bacterium]
EDSRAVRILNEMIKNEPDEELRRRAIQALGNTEHDDAVPVLMNIVRNNNSLRLRKEAVRALGQIDSPASQRAIEQILSEDLN